MTVLFSPEAWRFVRNCAILEQFRSFFHHLAVTFPNPHEGLRKTSKIYCVSKTALLIFVQKQ